ncbi:hypothetical protein [Nocardia sp. NRRL S-836]|uniref:hypothetical protein n=1 Tax=Nocardia sp. NRRL S-836 TaxID=1519492 RepID=UPI0006AE2525|nr:hypothetical protein [Nocardia sp. NRRL S-836]KOV78018.1 hypothetical protein ADL03_40920 [Nocardia sp. NRRL S-836]
MTAFRLTFSPCDLPLDGRLVEVVPGRYDWVHLDLSAPVGEATVWLHYRDAVDPEFLRSLPGTSIARIGVPRREELVAVELPALPGVRLLGTALT